MALPVDEHGMITAGRFAGRHIDDVLQYAEQVEKDFMEGGTPPPKPPAAPPKNDPPPNDPNANLVKDSAGRVNNFVGLIASRAILDDEEKFSATVSDYAQFKDKIAEMKKNLPPEVLIQPGIHRRLYINLKTEDPAIMARLMGQDPPADPEPEVPPVLEGEEPPVEPEVPPAVPPKLKIVPKAAPPSRPPTPAARSAAPQPKARVAKLKGTTKTETYCKRLGIDHGKYLLDLEDKGFSQSDIEGFNTPAQRAVSGGRKSHYDYADE